MLRILCAAISSKLFSSSSSSCLPLPCCGLPWSCKEDYVFQRCRLQRSIGGWPGGGEKASTSSLGIEHVADELVKMLPSVRRSDQGTFLFAIDHCFGVRGQGTVLTGTVLSGGVKVRAMKSLDGGTPDSTWIRQLQFAQASLSGMTVPSALDHFLEQPFSGVAPGQVADTIELPGLRVQKKIRSMQMFRLPIQKCQQVGQSPCRLC